MKQKKSELVELTVERMALIGKTALQLAIDSFKETPPNIGDTATGGDRFNPEYWTLLAIYKLDFEKLGNKKQKPTSDKILKN